MLRDKGLLKASWPGTVFKHIVGLRQNMINCPLWIPNDVSTDPAGEPSIDLISQGKSKLYQHNCVATKHLFDWKAALDCVGAAGVGLNPATTLPPSQSKQPSLRQQGPGKGSETGLILWAWKGYLPAWPTQYLNSVLFSIPVASASVWFGVLLCPWMWMQQCVKGNLEETPRVLHGVAAGLGLQEN